MNPQLKTSEDSWNISAEELQKKIHHVVLVDVREPEEHIEDHISGDILMPLGEILRRAPDELNPDSEIVLYCARGIRSLHALAALRTLGFKNLKSLQGGILNWRRTQTM